MLLRQAIVLLAIFLTLGRLAPVLAQENEGITNYLPEFFASARPATAGDMLDRLPGFSLNTGTSVRGFAGAAGNVLVDGRPPTSKTDDLNTVLSRIPASSVARIELIRGGAPGIDMQGQTVVANIVLAQTDASHIVVTAKNGLFATGLDYPGLSLQYTKHSGQSSYELTLARTTQGWDDSVGAGHRNLIAPDGTVTRDLARRFGADKTGYSLHGSAEVPLWGGTFANNLTLQQTFVDSGVAYSSPAQRIDTADRQTNLEFGSHWQGNVGATDLEALVLERAGHETSVNTSNQPPNLSVFRSASNTDEIIGRVTARYSLSPELGLEAGGEMTYNSLDGATSYVANGAPVALPSANAFVEEKRGELFGDATWKLSPHWSLEAGARFEYSTISETGDVNLSRTFFYPKPRALLTWSPDDRFQVRLRVERAVGQLDFLSFIASSNFANNGVSAGNPELQPDRRWQYESSFEWRFWGKGALVATVLHEEITDLLDYIPVGGGLDAPGNIPKAGSDYLIVSGTVPLDHLGLEGARFNPTLTFRDSHLTDPVTGETRPISNQQNRQEVYEFEQDLQGWHSTWGGAWITAVWRRGTYRIAQESFVRSLSPFFYVFWDYKPSPAWVFHAELDNFTRYNLQIQQFNYAGPRNTSPLTGIQDVHTSAEPQLFIQVRREF
jgi:outer membrane receptor protein involved in Fe transport